MEKLALLVTLEAKPGKENEVEQFLNNGLEIVEHELKTISWYALKMGNGVYYVFDTFEREKGRLEHLNGDVAKAMAQKAGDLLVRPPKIELVDLLAVEQESIHYLV